MNPKIQISFVSQSLHIHISLLSQLPDEEQADIGLEQCEVWEERLDQCRRHVQVSHSPDNCMQCIHHQADQLCSGKASQRTLQCGFLVLPTTESLLLDLTTLNLAAQSGTRFAFIIQVVDNEASSNNALMKYYQQKNIR